MDTACSMCPAAYSCCGQAAELVAADRLELVAGLEVAGRLAHLGKPATGEGAQVVDVGDDVDRGDR